MVYLESIRYNRRVALRNVVSGQRVPMELTSLGRAYLAVAPESRRNALLKRFKERRGAQWPSIGKEVDRAMEDVRRRGYCAASWQPEVVALAAPLGTAESPHVVNVSVSTDESIAEVARRLSTPLLRLVSDIQDALQDAAAKQE